VRARCERPRHRRATEKRDELAAVHVWMVRLMSAQYVKAYIKRNKHDAVPTSAQSIAINTGA
jgi:hypothetical protein